MSEPQYGSAGEQPSFDKPAADPSGPPPQQPGYDQAPPPQQPYGQPQGTPPQGGAPGYPPQGGAPGYPPPQGGSPQGGYPQGGQGFSQELSPSDQRMWATLAHAGGILFSFVAPLVVWLIQKDKGLYVTEQSKEALNFQITLLIGYLVAGLLTFIVIGFVIYPIIWVVSIAFGIIAAMASNKGENYRYPFALRLIS